MGGTLTISVIMTSSRGQPCFRLKIKPYRKASMQSCNEQSVTEDNKSKYHAWRNLLRENFQDSLKLEVLLFNGDLYAHHDRRGRRWVDSEA